MEGLYSIPRGGAPPGLGCRNIGVRLTGPKYVGEDGRVGPSHMAQARMPTALEGGLTLCPGKEELAGKEVPDKRTKRWDKGRRAQGISGAVLLG